MRPRRWLISATVLACALAAPGMAQENGSPADSPAPNPLSKRPPNPLSKKKPDPFVGVFKNDELTVTLKGGPAAYTGTIVMADNALPMTAQREGQTLTGTFTFRKFNYPFKAKLDDQTLTFTTDETDYALTRVGGSAAHALKPTPRPPVKPTPRPPSKPVTPPPPKPVTAAPVQPIQPITVAPPGQPMALDAALDVAAKPDNAAPPSPKWVTMGHRRGVSMRHPDGWRFMGNPSGGVLAPPDAVTDVSGWPLELVFFHRSRLPVDPTASDEDAVRFVEDYVQSKSPAMKRAGKPRRFDTLLGPGLVMTFEGRMANNVEATGLIYTTMHQGHRVLVCHLARRDLIGRYKLHAERMFRSLGFDQGERSPSLVGTWTGSFHSGRGAAAKAVNVSLSFDEQGTVTRAIQAAGASSGSVLQAAPVDNRQGAWRVAGGRLYVAWDDGATDVFAFNLGGNRLALARDGATGMQFIKASADDASRGRPGGE